MKYIVLAIIGIVGLLGVLYLIGLAVSIFTPVLGIEGKIMAGAVVSILVGCAGAILYWIGRGMTGGTD